MRTFHPDISPKDRSTALLVFGFLLACYMLTFTGVIDSSDGLATFAVTENLVRRGAFDNNQLLWMGAQQGNIGPDGNLYTRKGLGMALLAVPLVWIARVWPSVGMVHAAMLINPLLTAWTGALIFRLGRRFGWSRGLAITVALIYGLFTLAWPYTQTFFSDPVCGWGLFAAAYGLVAYGQSRRKRYLFGAGLAWGVAYLARTINLLTLPIYLIGLWFVLPAIAAHVGETTLERLRRAFWLYWRPVVAFGIPVVTAGLLSLWWNWARFGSVWDTGYVESETFSANWLFGLFGLTVGPARGFVWYNPILLLAIPGSIWFWRHQRRFLILTLALIALYFVVYAKWYMWHGGYSWGARFITPTLPFFSVLAAPGWQMLVSERRLGWPGAALAAFLLAASLLTQGLGLLVPYRLVQDRLAERVQPLFADETFTRLEYSPLLMQWEMIRRDTIQFAWWRGGPWPDTIDWLPFIVSLLGVLVGLAFLTQQMRSVQPENVDDHTRNLLYGFALTLLIVGLLTYYNTVLVNPEARMVAERIQQEGRRGDAVLLLRVDWAQDFANVHRSTLPVYGPLPRPNLDESDEMLLNRLRNTYQRLWVTPDYTPPEQSGWERSLRIHDFLLMDDRISGPSNQRLALYAMAPSAEMIESGLGTIFGDPSAAPINDTNGWIRLRGYALTPTAQPGGHILLTLLWQSLQPVEKDYQVFVHLLNDRGEKVLQRDGQPVLWMRPTSTWRPGDEILDRYGLLLPPTLATGRYTLAVGLYDAVTGQRLAVSAGPTDFAIELGPIEVE
ncbi:MULTISPECIES: hypothetical protein [Caldilinea]|uniref:Glycosyltransferase RgtA/B/C/D-like domain-containing protein n=1 Tax=Caldilinea aerophila (strain DSM 14535 / JCM 11387 / NBRC 104270 / STL-6-O1) TaxID=926550 RepID=I0HZP8_CALAS|nr:MULTISPECIES: hypothetical protein [Caldilinea]BAL98485.1 hypothetical protein CLDAP_04460 [Caldilinea aerophila DSM 14535 = NBRC 104270]GIV74934.1 MAG: hypothetical protein KatS3mg049_3490 [Caldilinea sp.]